MKKTIALSIFNISLTLCFAQPTTNTDSLLNNNNWNLNSIDSCGQLTNFPSQTKFQLSFSNFKSKKTKTNRFDRYLKRKGYYTGKFYLKTDEQDHFSKNWCNIKGYYKITGNELILMWDDNFKVEENFNQINPKLDLWFLIGTNASGEILFDNNSMILNMKQTSYKKDTICIKFIITQN